MIQSKEGPQILAALKEIHNTLGAMNFKLTAQDKKIEANTERLQALWEVVKTFHTTSSGMEFEKPAFIPFTTYKQVKNYDKSSEKEQEKLKKWLILHHIRTNVADNVREIFSKGRLMTDELLTLVVWEGHSGKKSSKKQLFRRRVTHDLRQTLLEMYPSMTDTEFKSAVQKA
ncbi:GSCOCG00012652001-RA-CDS, partial [Cotesia congregata]